MSKLDVPYPRDATLAAFFRESASDHPMQRPSMVPTFFDFGMGFFHDMPCPVYHGGRTEGAEGTGNDEPNYGPQESALFGSNGVFQPSYRAQAEGWKLVKVDTKFQRWLLRRFFGVE